MRRKVIPGGRLIKAEGPVRDVLARVLHDVEWLAREAPEIGKPLWDVLHALPDLAQVPPGSGMGNFDALASLMRDWSEGPAEPEDVGGR